jgi:hypothetical protein
LIGADDERFGVSRSDRPSLGQGQSADQGDSSLLAEARFIDLRSSTLKEVVHSRQKLTPVARGGC